VVLAVAVAAALVVGSVAPANAEDPLFVGWSALLPGFTEGYDPSSENDCKAGRVQCVDSVIREMERRFEPLASSCNHNAVFALTYLRTTEEYRRTVDDGTFFSDTPFINHQDMVFARYYFDAWDAYDKGEPVSEAWRIAFDTADRRRVTGMGDMLLGMSAHVNRDLPYVLAAIGLVKPDGSTRKVDHDKVNQFLNRVIEPLLAEAARRFDPTIDDGNVPGVTIDETAALQLLVSWRENAWRNAEALVAATTITRPLVEAKIESDAALVAQSLVTSMGYPPLLDGSGARDGYCATHWDS
jgi:hypothetical protein